MQTELRDIQNQDEWPETVLSLEQIPDAPHLLSFSREKNSHRGIGEFKTLRKLSARGVNEAFLREICELEHLEYLEMETITAVELEPIAQLRNLQTLKLRAVRKADEFGPLLELPGLQRLFIENAKHLSSLEFLAEANHLRAIGVEGSMWTKQRIEGLSALSHLEKLEGLFLTAVSLRNKSLRCLAEIPNLRVMECARFAPKSEFDLLRALMPHLKCRWCDAYDIPKL
ncbi:MAG: hypothetical protein AAF236_08085 [Verrucomicrobiota bacterium]